MKKAINEESVSQEEKKTDLKFHLTKEGSLGLLAYGDLGLMAWRKVRQGIDSKSESRS